MAKAVATSILKTWLNTSGLSQSNQPLYQLINALIENLNTAEAGLASVSGGFPPAITGLNTDVVATGPGNVPATIQPNVVTYSKIQQVTGLRLLGNPDAALADVVEIPLGDNLDFVDGVLTVEVTPGVPGLLHRLLSTTHPDTVPAKPIEGDIIYAGPGALFEGTYVYAQIEVSEVIDLPPGNYLWFYPGFNGAGSLAPLDGAFSPIYNYVANTPTPQWLTWNILQFYIQVSPIISDIGIFFGLRINAPGSGNYFQFYPYDYTYIVPPDPFPDVSTGLWQRKGIGTEGQYLTVVSGIPEWTTLVIPPPPEPSYPWTDIPFSAGDFTADGGVTPTWTVASGDVERWQKQQFPGVGGIGNNVRVALYLRATTVGGTAPTQLRVTLPFNVIGRFAQFVSIQENGAASNDVYIEYDDAVSTNTLFINKIAGAVFDTTAAGTYLAFEISAVLAP